MAPIGAFTDDPALYNAHPFLISATCKTEGAEDHEKLVKTALHSVEWVPKANADVWVWSMATDGDSTRRKIYYNMFMTREFSPDSPIRHALGDLALFDFHCGKSDITNNCDYRHIIKCARRMLIRIRGVVIDGVVVNEASIRMHLGSTDGLKAATLRNFLNPNNHQDVPLSYALLSCFSRLKCHSWTRLSFTSVSNWEKGRLSSA